VVCLTHHAGVHEKGTFSLQNLMESIKKNENYAKAGAVCLFIGVTRGETIEGEKVEKLTLEAYEEKANEVLENICEDLTKKPGIVDVQIHHLLGDFNVGDDLVYVSVSGSHRTQIFPVLQEAVERYKHEAPVFKKEQTISQTGTKNEYWVSEKRSNKTP
jgi:molybdopterin synthase catalytic subunit